MQQKEVRSDRNKKQRGRTREAGGGGLEFSWSRGKRHLQWSPRERDWEILPKKKGVLLKSKVVSSLMDVESLNGGPAQPHRSAFFSTFGNPPFGFSAPWEAPFRFPSPWKGHRSGSLSLWKATVQVSFTMGAHRSGPPFRFPSLWKVTVQVFCTMGGHRSDFLHCGRATVQVPFTVEGHRSDFLHCERPPFWITTSPGLGT
ncbi:hypothetical protein Taro_006735 [Colocasia esculenta]|uniref:Uncharacterized protein n=1 Tax=Colocasia esculenta TaxID=4460 RepID=A0A843TXT0_COLES|nr:hypothetical protein [Colocasia esculenta]